MSKVTAFLDTNIFLHYQPVTQMPWLEILDSESAELAIAQVVLGELDDTKNYGRNDRLRSRARDVIRLVERAHGGEQPESFDSNVSLRYIEEPRDFDYEAARLARDVKDDRLVATALAYGEENSKASICLVSGDATPRLQARSRDLRAIDLPEDYRLDTESPAEKELRRLREQKQELEAASPDPRLCVLNGPEPTVLNAVIEPVEPVPEEEIAEEVENLSGLRDELADGRLQSGSSPLATGLATTVSDDEKERYKREFAEWLEDYEKYLRDKHRVEQFLGRIARAELGLHNAGKVPARDIDVELTAEVDIECLTEDEVPSSPEEPPPPTKPQTLQEMVRSSIAPPNLTALARGGISSPRMPRSRMSPDAFSPRWEIHGGSVRLTTHLNQVKQETTRKLPEFWILVPADDEPESFEFSYSLRAANVPGAISGEVHVAVNER